MAILIITTGGTIDKVYKPITGELTFDRTHVLEMLTEGRFPSDNLKIDNLMLIDSLDMTDRQREMIVRSSIDAPEKFIVITHGTSTMVETARRIKAALAGTTADKTIVLTGAMVPHSLRGSDALFNLGTALACVNSLQPGVYIAINGQYFEASKVRKDTSLGAFVSEDLAYKF